MGPLAEPWRPFRAVAARLLWTYYRAVKQREGVLIKTAVRPRAVQPKAKKRSKNARRPAA
jgi:DNA-3-methyladenine glycosylase II